LHSSRFLLLHHPLRNRGSFFGPHRATISHRSRNASPRTPALWFLLRPRGVARLSVPPTPTRFHRARIAAQRKRREPPASAGGAGLQSSETPRARRSGFSRGPPICPPTRAPTERSRFGFVSFSPRSHHANCPPPPRTRARSTSPKVLSPYLHFHVIQGQLQAVPKRGPGSPEPAKHAQTGQKERSTCLASAPSR
jgi:hypothetical protein